MQKQRILHGWTGKQVAEAFGCSQSRISRIELGSTSPTRTLVSFYDETFQAEGLLLSMYEVVVGAAEQELRRSGGKRRPPKPVAPGDASEFVRDTIPHGTMLRPGQLFLKTWTIRNSGTVPWIDRALERQGPLTGPGLITSPDYVPILDTEPGAEVTIAAPLKAPTYDCASVAYFKMVDSQRYLCFPDNYTLGLDVLVLVRGQLPDQGEALELYSVRRTIDK
jgi:transcriptional regulator with XRE-family HTH domain